MLNCPKSKTLSSYHCPIWITNTFNIQPVSTENWYFIITFIPFKVRDCSLHKLSFHPVVVKNPSQISPQGKIVVAEFKIYCNFQSGKCLNFRKGLGFRERSKVVFRLTLPEKNTAPHFNLTARQEIQYWTVLQNTKLCSMPNTFFSHVQYPCF